MQIVISTLILAPPLLIFHLAANRSGFHTKPGGLRIDFASFIAMQEGSYSKKMAGSLRNISPSALESQSMTSEDPDRGRSRRVTKHKLRKALLPQNNRTASESAIGTRQGRPLSMDAVGVAFGMPARRRQSFERAQEMLRVKQHPSTGAAGVAEPNKIQRMIQRRTSNASLLLDADFHGISRKIQRQTFLEYLTRDDPSTTSNTYENPTTELSGK